jgi:hypothetical protein
VKDILISALAFFPVPLAISVICWCGGFNFDCRTFEVGFGAALAIFIGYASSAMVYAIRRVSF